MSETAEAITNLSAQARATSHAIGRSHEQRLIPARDGVPHILHGTYKAVVFLNHRFVVYFVIHTTEKNLARSLHKLYIHRKCPKHKPRR